MASIDVAVHKNGEISFKDLSNDIDLSQSRWDFLFNDLIKRTEAIYFNGCRNYFSDSKLDEAINFLSEKMLAQDRSNNLFRLKQSSLILSRNLLSKVWAYYEYPAIIFLSNQKDEHGLIKLFNEKKTYVSSIVNLSNGIYVIYQSFQPNVLWVKSDQGDIPRPTQ